MHTSPENDDCFAIRQAARHISQLYERHLSEAEVTPTQFSILTALRDGASLTMLELAQAMVMDRTTLGRNILPLERDGLISVAPGVKDRRSKELRLSEAGAERLKAGHECWKKAQKEFAAAFGDERTVGLRALLREVTATDLPVESSPAG